MQRKKDICAFFCEKSCAGAFFCVPLQRNLEYYAQYSLYISRRNR